MMFAQHGLMPWLQTMLYDVKNLDRPRPGVERVVKKRSASGGSRRQRILCSGHLPLAPPSKTLIGPQPDSLPTNRDAHPWFEGAGSRRRAGRAHAEQAVLGRFGVPRWKVLGGGARSGPAHRASDRPSRRPRVEPCPTRPRKRGRWHAQAGEEVDLELGKRQSQKA